MKHVGRHYAPPEDLAGTVFDPADETFGPIMAALQAGEFEQASALTAALANGAESNGPDFVPQKTADAIREVETFLDYYAQKATDPETSITVTALDHLLTVARASLVRSPA